MEPNTVPVSLSSANPDGFLEPQRSALSESDRVFAAGLAEGWLEELDLLMQNEPLMRKTAARILHLFLRKVCHEPDEEDWSPAKRLLDLYDCHRCVNHIAQVYVKGIMPALEGDTVFEGRQPLSTEEAALIVLRTTNKLQRIASSELPL